jgi:hypothetical protein
VGGAGEKGEGGKESQSIVKSGGWRFIKTGSCKPIECYLLILRQSIQYSLAIRKASLLGGTPGLKNRTNIPNKTNKFTNAQESIETSKLSYRRRIVKTVR